MKNIKKLLAAVSVLALALSLTACGPSNANTVSSAELSTTSGEEQNPAATDYKNDLEGLCSYLTDSELISGDPVVMEASVIGAVGGNKYTYSYEGAQIVTELYEYNLDDLESTASSTLESIKADGEFTVLDDGVQAMVSDNGKFVMIYTNNTDDDTQKAFSERIRAKFKAFDGPGTVG